MATTELKTIAPRKWVANFGGNTPTIDTTDGVRVGDHAVDSSTARVWLCLDNTDTAPVWTPAHAAILHVRDEKAQNTDGGTFTSGAWRTRDLNTSKTNTIGGASLAANQVTLPAGTYWCEIKVPGHNVDQHQARLYNVTGAAVLVIGTSESTSTNLVQTSSWIRGRFTLTASSALEVRHWCITTRADTGFGYAANITTEIYTDAVFWKES